MSMSLTSSPQIISNCSITLSGNKYFCKEIEEDSMSCENRRRFLFAKISQLWFLSAIPIFRGDNNIS